MGFKVPKRTVLLEFDEASGFHGAEIRCRLDITTEAFFELQRLRDAHDEAQDERRLRDMLEFFLDNIVIGWNLEDEETGESIPVSLDAALKQLPPRLSVGLIPLWMAATGVTPPLEPTLSAGEILEAHSTRTADEPSESQES